jgi:hypothetical protein
MAVILRLSSLRLFGLMQQGQIAEKKKDWQDEQQGKQSARFSLQVQKNSTAGQNKHSAYKQVFGKKIGKNKGRGMSKDNTEEKGQGDQKKNIPVTPTQALMKRCSEESRQINGPG